MIGGRIVSAPTLDLWHFPGPVRTPAPTQKLSSVGRGRCLIGPPSMAGQTTWNKPGGPKRSETKFRRKFFAKLSFKKACRGQRNPPPGRRNYPLAGCSFQQWKEPKIAGGRRNRTGGKTARSSMSSYPRTPLRRTLPWGCSAHPARAGQGIVVLSAPLPLARRFRKSPAGWMMEARLVSAAVGAGSDSAGG